MKKTPTPYKNLGQHWLYDAQSLEQICRAAHINSHDTVLEIGPGLGTLTSLLVQRSAKVIAVELDPRLAKSLPQRVPASNLEVVHDDILHFNLSKLSTPYKVVANVPYYITSKITRLLLETDNPPAVITLLVQKEVAERMAAQPGAMSILAIAVQLYCTTTLGPVIPAERFTPPPQVDSQVITLTRRDQALFTVDTKVFFRLVRAGFSEKRKKLRNSLSGSLQISKEQAETLLARARLPAESRAEELDLIAWYNLYKAMEQTI